MKAMKELVGASTGLLVLSILAKEASYGYQIVRNMNRAAEYNSQHQNTDTVISYKNRAAEDVFEWQEGTVYPVLHKLEKEELVRTQWQEADTGRRRKYYYITARGRESLGAQEKQWEAFYGMIQRIGETGSNG